MMALDSRQFFFFVFFFSVQYLENKLMHFDKLLYTFYEHLLFNAIRLL